MGTPKAPLLQESFHDGGFIVCLADGHRSIDQIVLTGAAKVLPGTVLGKLTTSGKFAPLSLTATDGSQIAAGILYAGEDATLGDVPAVAIVRAAEVNATELVFPPGATSNQIAAAMTTLLALRIVMRS